MRGVRALKTLVRVTMFVTLLATITFGIVVPASWLYTAANLPNEIESAADVELHLRQSIESERQSVELTRSPNRRESVKWPRPDFSALPRNLIALYITQWGCPEYFQSPREEGWPWLKRLLLRSQDLYLPGDGGCELIFSRNLARRLQATSAMQVTVASDRIHRYLSKDELVAFDLTALWFRKDVIGVEKASRVLFQKQLTELSLAELAELELVLPPLSFWQAVYDCSDPSLVKSGRDRVLSDLAQVQHITHEVAREEMAKPLRCTSIKR